MTAATERPSYPHSQLADSKVIKGWPKDYKEIRTCLACGKVYLKPCAAYTCEQGHLNRSAETRRRKHLTARKQ
ncbi:hypothetical protein AB0N89_33890 [Amycolatopsis sp. NPDC089917]|uniref:hypothetical protein n=1 Tax=Amycolatopsis sp. NPDC089917 TaxID=3155187 RepID=UPI0034352168